MRLESDLCLLLQAAKLEDIQLDLLPLEHLTEEIQYWHRCQITMDNQGGRQVVFVLSGHPYQESMQEVVSMPNVKGLTVIFSPVSATLNSTSSLTIAHHGGHRMSSVICRGTRILWLRQAKVDGLRV